MFAIKTSDYIPAIKNKLIMFKKTSVETQLGIFSTPNLFLSGQAESFYERQDSWHNLFRLHVTSRIDESICKPLFTHQTGSPNSSVRVLISMMVLKEANGWSDGQLFEQCRFNLLVRSALGLMNMDDAVPAESTYYLFRKRIVAYEKTEDVNLFEKTFAAVTKAQATDFEVSGKSIRMDSKLLGSNIAWLSRYELIHETLRLFCQDVKWILANDLLTTLQRKAIENLLKETGNKVVYRSTSVEVKTKMQELGQLAYILIQLFDSPCSPHYQTLKRIFSEQFTMDDDGITVSSRNKEEISADSVQSPHDTDCHYRNKGGNQVKGYSMNVTESCDDQSLNLISGIEVKVITAADNDFLQNGIHRAKEIFTDTVEKVHADGAYHSTGNQVFCTNENVEFLINAIQGAKTRFDLIQHQDGKLTIKDTQTGELIPATKLRDKDKWRIKVGLTYKYFGAKEITASVLKRKIAAIPQEILNIRNNVEATIFQLGFHYSNDKTRYRGLIKHKMWANIRCMWLNFVRIKNYVTQKLINTELEVIYNAISDAIIKILAPKMIVTNYYWAQTKSTTKIQFFPF